MPNQVRVFHNTDLGETIGVVNGKAEVVKLNENTEGAVQTNASRGFFSETKDGVTYVNTAFIDNSEFGESNYYAKLRRIVPYDEFKAFFDEAVTAGANRIAYTYGLTSLNLSKQGTGEWMLNGSALASSVTAFYGYTKTVNDPANPLFVELTGGAFSPVEISGDTVNYLHSPRRYLRLIDGATL